MKEFLEEVYCWGGLQHTGTIKAKDKDEAMKIAQRTSEDAFPDNEFIHIITEVKKKTLAV